MLFRVAYTGNHGSNLQQHWDFNAPTSRSYMITYAAGRELCRSYVTREPDGFKRLLSEQVRVGELLDANTRS